MEPDWLVTNHALFLHNLLAHDIVGLLCPPRHHKFSASNRLHFSLNHLFVFLIYFRKI